MQLPNYINGIHQASSTLEYIPSVNPATGAVIHQVPISTAIDVDAAVQAAQAAFPLWSGLTVLQRSTYLQAIATEIHNQSTELAQAEVHDSGKTITQATNVDIPRAAENFAFFAQAILDMPSEAYITNEHVHNQVIRQPVGVVACISPWNLPLYLFTWKIAPALAVGNCVVAKPSEVTSLTASMLGNICTKVGLPPGVLNIVLGNGTVTGNALISHIGIKAISFTGSTQVGKHIAQVAAANLVKVSLELGGKNPAIVLPDANLATTIPQLIKASFSNQGQICLCSSKILIHEALYQQFKTAFVLQTNALVIGNPTLATTQVGAMVSQAHYHKVLHAIQVAKAEGATVLCGGNAATMPHPLEHGYYIQPTVIQGLPNDCATNQEEIFGPVVSLIPYSTVDEAITMANHNKYGLSATVWGNNATLAQQVASQLQAGVIWVNCWLVRDLRTPFGGFKLSGIGREGGNEALRFFTEASNVCTYTSS